ncbi:Pkinase-domain-containing protein [Trichodelitschia bisporula]|uniref:cAMP-dependent protein kinase n=1 Tax=Trichodelitschia bisporula TaxID=703511 RepID=A0A6G1HI87_9PEZI|nr:Pkinase-domain-containing protein [Trichodelitschia bisporula]
MAAAAISHILPNVLRSSDDKSSDNHGDNHGDEPSAKQKHDSGAGTGAGAGDSSRAHASHWHSNHWNREHHETVPSQNHAHSETLNRRTLRCEDFQLIKTLGTGTFARVWLVKLAEPADQADADKVFALKILRKVDVIRLKQVEHVRNERNVLAAVVGHPFITTLQASFQDRESLYMLLDYCPGGEVFSYLRRARRFNEPTSQFYAAEIVLILEFLHEKQGVAYRDLKPENILIDAEGHLKLVDFGFAKKVDNRETYTLCGTPEYLAPEVIKNTGHGRAVDWWAFGILIYEFLVGQPPFWDQNPLKIYEQIVEGRVRYPAAMSADARSIIGGLCTVDTSKRLGNIQGGAAAVKAHPWFRDINWDDLYHRRMPGPIVPHLRGPADTRNFDEYEPEAEGREPYTDEKARLYDEAFKDF